jgi:F-type H+-transporting ATPase subunit epsilon
MQLEIVTPDKKVYEGPSSGVQVPGIQGSFEVLENHAAIVSALGPGTVRVAKAGGAEYYDIDGGVIEVLNNQIVILAESAVPSARP